MINIDKVKRAKSTRELLEFSIINIDKPTGPTSFTVSQFVKRALECKKTAHLGTLDPAVTGVLPVALNRACRLNEYLMHRDKTYVGIMRIHKENVKDSILRAQIRKLTGKITQLPPKRSAVKRAPRERTVRKFNILERSDQDVLFETQVQAGTYIRKLIHDIGLRIDGAHMLELRRTAAGIFSETHTLYPSITLYDFETALEEYKDNKNEKPLRDMLIPGEIIATFLPAIQIKKDAIKKALSGSPIFQSFLKSKQFIANNINKNDKLCIFSGDKFIGCYNYVGEEDIIAKPEFVFN